MHDPWWLPKLDRGLAQARSQVRSLLRGHFPAAQHDSQTCLLNAEEQRRARFERSVDQSHELPAVIVDVMRGGPGLGNLAPEQGDYNQVVKGGGHGNYRVLALALDGIGQLIAAQQAALR